jgi:hypothetical protein
MNSFLSDELKFDYTEIIADTMKSFLDEYNRNTVEFMREVIEQINAQHSEMLKEAISSIVIAKPSIDFLAEYITDIRKIVSEIINHGNVYGYFVIKNSGKTGARITCFEHDAKFPEKETPKNAFVYTHLKETRESFKYVTGLYLAPNQRFMFFYINPDTEEELIRFKITYESLNKTYVSEGLFRLVNYYRIPEVMASKNYINDKEDYQKAIANILKDISTKRL